MEATTAANVAGACSGVTTHMILFVAMVVLLCGGLITLIISLKQIAGIVGNKEKNERPAGVLAAGKRPAVAAATPDEAELVAVITAAVTAALGNVRVTGIGLSSARTAFPPKIRSSWRMASIMENSGGV
ncbi:MAG: OadG family protein [Synergistaceae bacterium]|nr:OadG family protein [Synergistaceae bacterium]